MAKRREPKQKLYGTKQVAEILGIAEWRVKNFTEGGAYGLSPSQIIGTGRGSRRLYNEDDVLRLAIANELVNCGFTPESVGNAVGEIPRSHLKNWYTAADSLAWSEDDLQYQSILVCAGGKWREETMGQIDDWIQHGGLFNGSAPHGVFILNFPTLLDGVIKRMHQQSERDAKDNSEDGGKR